MFCCWTIPKTLMKMVTLCHICLIFVKSVLNFLYSNVQVFLCSVFLSPFTNSYFEIASSSHIQLHLMFTLKILKIQNLMCKIYANEQHANSAIIISMFIEAC